MCDARCLREAPPRCILHRSAASVAAQEGTPVAALVIPGEEAKLKFHPDWEREQRAMGATG